MKFLRALLAVLTVIAVAACILGVDLTVASGMM